MKSILRYFRTRRTLQQQISEQVKSLDAFQALDKKRLTEISRLEKRVLELERIIREEDGLYERFRKFIDNQPETK